MYWHLIINVYKESSVTPKGLGKEYFKDPSLIHNMCEMHILGKYRGAPSSLYYLPMEHKYFSEFQDSSVKMS